MRLVSCCICDCDVVTCSLGAWDPLGSWHLNCVSKVGIFLMPQTYMRKDNCNSYFSIGFQDYILWAWRSPGSLALISGAYGRWGLIGPAENHLSHCCRHRHLWVLSHQSTQTAAKPSSLPFQRWKARHLTLLTSHQFFLFPQILRGRNCSDLFFLKRNFLSVSDSGHPSRRQCIPITNPNEGKENT